MAKKKTTPGALAGSIFTFTGTLHSVKRDEAIALVRTAGGTVVDDVNDTVNYLIVGEVRSSPSAAEKKAAKLNHQGACIAILDESQFADLLKPTPDQIVAMLKGGPKGLKEWKTLSNWWKRSPIELRKVDLRKINLEGVELEGVHLIAVDFREANLNGVRLHKAEDCRFDGATIRNAVVWDCTDCTFKGADLDAAIVNNMRNCTFDKVQLRNGYFSGSIQSCSVRNADLSDTRLNPADLTGSDFTGTKVLRSTASYTQGQNVVFARADLRESSFDVSKFHGANFAGADLRQAHLQQTDFTDAIFRGAKLNDADLRNSTLCRADLSGADLRGANLIDVDLTGANVAGANLADANLAGASVTDVDFSKAKNFNPDQLKTLGAIGPNIRELVKFSKSIKHLQTSVNLDVNGERVEVLASSRRYGSQVYPSANYIHFQPNLETHNYVQATSFDQGMLNLAKRWPNAQVKLESVTIKAPGASLKGQALRELAIAAWCEAFGIEPPSSEMIAEQDRANKQSLAQLHETMLQDLRSGSAGMKRWNARSEDERRSVGSFRQLDLTGLNLSKFKLAHLDFQETIFDQASLSGASLESANLRQASFKGARLDRALLLAPKLAGVSFENASLTGCKLRALTKLETVNFHGADLSKSDLWYTDLRGVDLSGAKLDQISFGHNKFDERTRFPPGFSIPLELLWAGTGTDPRLATIPLTTSKTGSLSFEEFMDRLRGQVRSANLQKALAMLKAERFQLFAQAEPDSIIGVVKSQSDPNLLYSCRLTAVGSYSCCTQNLNRCGGLQGGLCKHLLVLVVGLTKAGQLDGATVEGWVQSSNKQKPMLDKDIMTATFLRYKGAEAGEVDWRPTETIPEDYYAL
jgi:uncharacterized protein YjbI with pentapeptide repeats